MSVLAGSAAGAVLAMEWLVTRKILWREAVLLMLPLLTISGLTYGMTLRRVGWQTLVTDNLTILSAPQLNYFSRNLSGVADWPKSVFKEAALQEM